MSRVRLSPWFLVCFTLLAGTAFAQTTFDRKTYAHSGLVRGDFNLDGNPDLLGAGTNFRVLLNNGDGTFRGPVTGTPAGAVAFLQPTDFNHDGRTDLVGCFDRDSQFPPQEFAIWIGAGDANFSQPRTFLLLGDCQAVAVDDFNDDGKQDAVVVWTAGNVSNSLNNGVTVFLGDGAGGVSNSVTTEHIAAINSDDLGCAFRGGIAGNYDRAGSPDVVVTASCANDTFDQSVVLFGKGTGTGQFTFSKTDDVNASLRPMKDDVNQDSRLDVVVRSSLSGPTCRLRQQPQFLEKH